MKARWLTIAAIVLQILAVAAIAINKEWVLATGESVTLQTAPVDPRDIFRGDYVVLDYAFSRLPSSQLAPELYEDGLRKGQKVYLALNLDQHGVAQAKSLHANAPDSGLFLAARVTHHWPYAGYPKHKPENDRRPEQPVRLKYGLEQYFVEQGAGKAIEATRGGRDDFQVPMLVDVAVSGGGAGVIRKFDWANIAMKTEILRSPETNALPDAASAVMRFTLKNRLNRPMTLPLKPGNCSFELIPTHNNPLPHGVTAFKRPQCDVLKTADRILNAGEDIHFDFDLNHEQWWVAQKGQPTPPGKLPWNYRFRIVWAGEQPAVINAHVVSRAFHGRGNID